MQTEDTGMATIDEFRDSTADATPPASLGFALQALWWERKGDWEQAHGIVQQHEGQSDCDWVHGYLHRQEGDTLNAGGWYRRAGQSLPTVLLPEEWELIATALLSRAGMETPHAS